MKEQFDEQSIAHQRLRFSHVQAMIKAWSAAKDILMKAFCKIFETDLYTFLEGKVQTPSMDQVILKKIASVR